MWDNRDLFVFEDHTRGEESVIDCNKCRAATSHKIIGSRNFQLKEESDDGEHYGVFHSHDEYEILQCLGCKTVSFRHRHRDSESGEDDGRGNLIFPYTDLIYPPRRLRPTALTSVISLPFPIRDLYVEAATALDSKFFHLVALSLSPLIEAMLKEQGATGRYIPQLVEAAVKRGLITAAEAETLQRIRAIRNAGDHEAEKPLPESVLVAFSLIERMLERFYVAATLRDQLRRPGDPPPPNPLPF